MIVRRWVSTLGRLAIPVLLLVLLGPGSALATPDDAQARGKLAGLRLPFIPNEGQVDARVAYYAPTFAGTLFVTQQGELVYTVPGPSSKTPRGKPRTPSGPGWSLTETLVGGTIRLVAQDRSATGVSHFLGHDPARWRPALPTYEQLGLGEVWPGVTVALRARGRSIEKVFTVQPDASVGRIRVRMGGADALSLDSAGALVAGTELGPITFTAPLAYQERDGVRRAVAVAYQLTGREYGFTVGAYDRSLPLVIDPLLQSTYLGGSSDDEANALAIHPTTGDVYVAGITVSTNFPGTAGGAQPTSPGGNLAFVARLNSALTALTQATYLGGSDFDAAVATALAIHPTSGDVYVAGFTNSANFPLTSGGAQPTKDAGYDGFVARLSSDLTALTQATYLGGGGCCDDLAGNDYLYALAIHPTTGDVYVAGETLSSNFPGTTGGAQPAFGGGEFPGDGDAFVARLNSPLTVLIQASYLGGSSDDGARALAIHPTTGDVYVAGQTFSTNFPGTTGGAQPTKGNFLDAFIARLSNDLTALTQATYFGGSASEYAYALAIHPATGDVYVAGLEYAPDLGSQRAFVARFPSTLTAFTQATLLGSSDILVSEVSQALALEIHPQIDHLSCAAFGCRVSQALALAIHPTTAEVYVAGLTNTTDFPGTTGGAQPTHAGGFDGFVARLSSDLTGITQATYLGGSPDDYAFALAIHPTTGDVYVAGKTISTNFPGTAGGAQPTSGGNYDAFVARLTANLAAFPGPDPTLTKTHTGNFVRGQVGATYTLTVSNVGTTATTGMVTVTDTLPTGLTATALSGSGWGCTLGTLTCTRSDALASGSSYPAITLTVNVAANAPNSFTNTATVSGGGDVTPGNNTATDTITMAPDLTVAKTHSGNFSPGQVGAIYTITVSNVGTAAATGTVTVMDNLPTNLTATALSGLGWSCTLGTLTCTRSDALASGSSYPAITLTVNVAANTPTLFTNGATVSGGGDVTPFNNFANDTTTTLAPDLTVAKTHSGNFSPGQVGAIYTITVSNVGTTPTGGTITVTDTLPAGLTATALSGFGWSCTLGTLTCTRPDPLFPTSSYLIILTVTVADNAPSSVTNTATVSGGGDVTPGNNTANDLTSITTFTDAPPTSPFAPWIEALFRAGITAGCSTSPPQYCPGAGVTRGQMAVFLLRGIHGAGYEPPAATGTMFADVPVNHPFAKWIEQLAREAIIGGCTPTTYCPDATVTRGETAMLLLLAEHGTGFDPPAPTGATFTDVPVNHPFAKWIEQLAREGITAGCGATTYCPDAAATREQMAVFLVRTFNLPM